MGKWDEFASDRYAIHDLGREFRFLIPSCKLKTRFAGSTIEEIIRRFIRERVRGISYSPVPYSGEWPRQHEEWCYDESRPYFAAFLGKERIPIFLEFLAAIAKEIREECIYISAGQYSATVVPTDTTRSLQELIKQS